MARDLRIGDKIRGQWEIFDTRAGGTSIVYIVADTSTPEFYAAKTYQEDVFGRFPSIKSMINDEARLWIDLGVHKHVVRCDIVFEFDGKTFIFLDYISGGNLGKPIETGNNSVEDAADLCLQICNGMAYATSKGVIAHRDLKPANCLMTRDGVLKITDFGLAKVKEVISKQGGGTAEYMAPEQWRDFDRADARSDIYAIGAIFFEIVAGNPPYGKRPDINRMQLRRSHQTQDIPSLHATSKLADEFVRRCLAKRPSDRFQSFQETQDFLSRICGRERVSVDRAFGQRHMQAGDLMKTAISLASVGRDEEALECFKLLVSRTPRDKRAWSNKGTLHDKLHDYDEAIRCYDKALAIDRYYAIALCNKGEALRNLRRFEEALGFFERALAIDPDYIEANNNMGYTLHQMGRPDEALVYYDKVLRRDSGREQTWLNKALALRNLGLLADAQKCFARIERRSEFKLDKLLGEFAFRLTLGAGGESPGIEMLAAGKLEEAADVLEKEAQLHPKKADLLVARGIALGKAGKHVEAIAVFDEALKIADNNPGAWFNKGSALGRMGRAREELSCYDKAIELDLGYGKAWAARAQALQDLGKRGEALESWKRAIELDPRDSRSTLNIGRVLEASGQFEDASKFYSKAVEIDPQYQTAWYNCGAVFMRLGKFERAAECCERAINLNPEDESAWLNKAMALWSLKRHGHALNSLNRLLEINNENATAWVNKGVVLMDCKKPEEALGCFLRARELGHPNAEPAIEMLTKEGVQPPRRRDGGGGILGSLSKLFRK